MSDDRVRPDELPYDAAPIEIAQAMGGRPPTVQQWNAISHEPAPCSIVAGAGSGKTAVMAARVVYLAMVAEGRIAAEHEGALPSQMLCLTFTNKACEELTSRVRKATSDLGLPEGEEATVLTYHAFAARLLEEYGLLGGIEPGAQLLSEAQKWQLVTECVKDMEFAFEEVRNERYLVPKVLGLADSCQNHLVDIDSLIARCELDAGDPDEEIREAAQKRGELAQVAKRYQAEKTSIHAIDYGDQISMAVRLIKDHPEVGERFRERYRVVLLDEYQDTNYAQAVLLRELLGPGYPVTAVGDPDQNIYAWRGANLFNILKFPEEFPSASGPAERQPLYVNFRSGSRILAVADEIIGKVPEERRAGDKELRPHPDRGEGRVVAFTATDERAEALKIAAMIKETVGGDEGWDGVAILCRKKRLFGPIAEILRAEGVPLEVVDLGGLLRMPEIVDVLAWLQLLNDPARNVALARILMGPRWRVGYRDLAILSRWATGKNKALEAELDDDSMTTAVQFSLLEAIEHLDDEMMASISVEGLARLQSFRIEFAALRRSAHGPLGDLVARIAERSGLMRELEAAGTSAADNARLNLLNFVDHVTNFSPVSGEASLSTLVDYLLTAEESEDELAPAQSSTSNTVKMLTIHKAKGLEWPVVFVPGMADSGRSGIFPDVSRQADPASQAKTLPFELRGDRGDLPLRANYKNTKTYKDALRERGMEEERRLCYVALTRARDLLVVSSAYWYQGPKTPFEPSLFYKQVSGHDDCEVLDEVECPEENPLIEFRSQRAHEWPPPGHIDDQDELFPDGWHEAATFEAGDLRERAESLGAGVLAGFDTQLATDLERAALIDSRTRPTSAVVLPSSLSVSALVDYVGCPKRFYWTSIRPLPRKPNPKARLGSEVHKWIEQQSRGQTTLIDLDEVGTLPDVSPAESFGAPDVEQRLKDAFLGSRFAEAAPLYTERPFMLMVEDLIVRGRIDAIFGEQEGAWEVVDYKTGRVPDEGADRLGLQLDLYALACMDVWGKMPEDLTLSFYYLAADQVSQRPVDDADTIRQRVAVMLRDIAAARFEPDPSDHCRWCDFLSFCDAGKASQLSDN